MDRAAIFAALMPIGSSITWGSSSVFATKSDIYKNFSDDAQTQPAFYQTTHDEYFAQQSNLPYRVRLTAFWTVHYRVPEGASGDLIGHQIMGALQDAMSPRPTPGQPFDPNRNTLGGLVYHAFIDGRVFRDGGSLDGQGVIVVPISLLVP